MAKRKIEARIVVTQTPDLVMGMFTNSSRLREWLADVALITPRAGGRIYLAWNDGYHSAGEVREIEGERRFGFTWRGPGEEPTRVRVTLVEVDGDTAVRVRHSGFPAKAKRLVSELQRAWDRSLENLASVLDTGEDLRLTRRPMLGVYLEGEVCDTKGSVVGMRLSGVVEDMGAALAGLRGGDTITSLGGTQVRGSADMAAVLSHHQAGDELEVGLLREGQAEEVNMRLSGRRIGDIKSNPDELANQVRDMSSRFLGELEESLRDVTSDEAEYRPAADAWSIKEVLAHVLDSEGDLHGYIVESFEGVERLYDGGFGNSHWRTRVTADAYPDAPAMIDAYRRLAAETVGLIRAMPPQAAKQRSTFWRFAYNFSESADHLQEHAEQIRTTLDQAKAALAPASAAGR